MYSKSASVNANIHHKTYKQTLLTVITCSLFLLLVYTAVSKLLVFPVFVKDLGRSPLLSPYRHQLSVLVPAAELGTALLLVIPGTRRYGLAASVLLMVIFTAYVGYIVAAVTHPPCSCGGIIRELSWPQHLIFNSCFLALAVVGYALEKQHLKSKQGRIAENPLKE